ncbi:hypothetical protein DH2020_021476 [Rehmannia glutinosa]|uniref:Ariadne domain-containing protein n=1 Tax=Rehmannia glutinosa TaxID=99300 RepID=A0ABR0WD04_REHGL
MTCTAPVDTSSVGFAVETGVNIARITDAISSTRRVVPKTRSRLKAKKHLERYAHYYERWDSNDKSRKRALVDLHTAKTVHIELLANVQGEAQAQLKFVIEAWDQIVECRRVLKWSYAYGYYLSLNQSGKMEFFGHLQGQAESALERLHHCAEKEMSEYMSGDCRSEDFKGFRSKLAGLTLVTRNYFENLVTALENDLSEVENDGTKTGKSSEVESDGSKEKA